MLIARDGGCTKPGCTVGAYGCQVHHAVTDWARGGNTNVDERGPACGPDNRPVGEGGYTTTSPPAATWNGSPRPDSTTANPGSTITTAPELLLRPDDEPPVSGRDTREPGGPEPPDAAAA
jgi:hypothetical protein